MKQTHIRHRNAVEKGFVVVSEVVDPDTQRKRVKRLSRLFHVKHAAEQYAEMARSTGFPQAYVSTLYTTSKAEIEATA